MAPSTIVSVAPTRPRNIVLLNAAPELAAAEHRPIMLERQHVPLVEAEELEERADDELADRQHHA